MDIQEFFSDLRLNIATSSFLHAVIARIDQVLESDAVANAVFIMRAVGLLVTLVMLYLVVFVVIKTNLIGVKLLPLKIILNRPSKTKDAHMVARMSQIRKRIERKTPAEDRTAVVEASQLLEQGLTKVGQKGPLFRENVEGVPYWSSVTPDKIFSAYNIRTKLIHNPHEQVSHEEAEQAVETFERALKDLGVV